MGRTPVRGARGQGSAGSGAMPQSLRSFGVRAWHAAAFAAALLAASSAAPDHANAQFGGPSLSLTKSANPTTYTTAGDVITYTYTVTNTGGFLTVFNLVVNDNKVATVTCQDTILNAGQSTTCSGSYTITAADVTAGFV